MPSQKHTLLLIAAMLLAMLAPLAVALALAYHSAKSFEESRARDLARTALARSEETTQQIEQAFAAILALRTDLCSLAALQHMRGLDLGSSYIQAIGRVEGNEFICSSIAGRSHLAIGPVDVAQPAGTRLRNNVRFAFAPSQAFIVVERAGLGAIIHKSLPFSANVVGPEVSLALVTANAREILSAQGHFRLAWLHSLRPGQIRLEHKDGHIIALARSSRYELMTMAAVPHTGIMAAFSRTAVWLVPVALLAALVLGYGTQRLIVLQSSPVATFRRAIRGREFFMHYQPIVDLQSGRWVGAEALMRWNRPEVGLVAPDVFIPSAENAGVIGELTRHACALVADDCRGLFRAEPDFRVSINFAADDFHRGAVVGLVKSTLSRSGARPANIVVEATERSLTDHVVAMPGISELHALGVRLAVDDFGTGYSSLSMLATLNPDVLKIDKSFIDALGTDSAASLVVPHIIAMAKSLNMQMVAEGIEQAAQRDTLAAQGVQYGQGYLFGRPMAMDELRRQLAERRLNLAA